MKWPARLYTLRVTLSALPGLVVRAEERALLREMRILGRGLPALMEAPLPQAMAALTPAPGVRLDTSEATLRRLADLAALLERQSPLGICLRRSLLRYHFLRQGGVPLRICFGARFAEKEAGRGIAGHAWVTLGQTPYHEAGENWQGFAVIYRWPE